jgi:hypothetical protein
MSVIERWTIWPTFVLPGSGEPACVIEGPTVPPRETVEVVRASGYEGAVSIAQMIVDTWGDKELHSETAELAVELAEYVLAATGGQ